jgi:hypothetical protein
MQGSKSFDRGDGGIIWSLLLHPGKAAEVDPMYIGDWVSAFSDTAGNGMFTLRNRYRDADDTVVQMYLKLRGNRGHNGPDLLSFRMLGLGTAWAVGGGRYGTTVAGQDVFLSSMNTLYPGDPDKKLVISEEKGVVVGRPGIGGDGCGTVVGRAALSNLGVQEHVRRLGVDYRRDTGTDATVIISDTSSNGLYWQLCTLESNKVKPLADGFEIEGENGASLRGYILHAAGKPNLKVGQRLRGSKFGPYTKNGFVHFQSADGAFAVVLTLVQKGMNHPRVSVEAGSVWTGEVSAIVNVGAARFSVTDQGIRRAPLPVVRPSVAPPVQ